MKILIEQIEKAGLEVTYYNSQDMWVKAGGVIIPISKMDLFGLEKSDLILTLKKMFHHYNIKLDVNNPENNKTKGDEVYGDKDKKKKYDSLFLTVDEKKKKIRDLLTNKYKFL